MTGKINWVKAVGLGFVALGIIFLIIGSASATFVVSFTGAIVVVATALVAIFASDIKKLLDVVKAKIDKIISDIKE